MPTRLEQWKNNLKNLSDKRERNINKYIIPIEAKMAELRDKIRSIEPNYNKY